MSTKAVIAEARAAMLQGDAQGAEELLGAALEQAPFDAGLHIAFARTRWMMGKADCFADPMRQALAARPDNLDLRMALADLLRRAGQLDQAEGLLREGLARAPDEGGLMAALGVVLDEARQSGEAARLLAQACAHAPESLIMRQYYAQALLGAGNAEEAQQILAQLRRSKPLDQGLLALETLALRLLRAPRYRELCDYGALIKSYDLEPPPGYSSSADFNADLGQALRALHRETAHPLDQSLRGGSQSEGSLLSSPAPQIRAFLGALEAPIRDYISKLAAPAELVARRTKDYRLSGCWSVRLKPGGYHVNHVHPDGWISSAYYVAVPEGIEANRDEAGWLTFGAPRFPIAGCEIEKTIAPRVGQLTLFPSYFWHGVKPFRDGAERLTAAFDVVPA
jgi:uncharacterized protein (TIGR02466 family)